jgi:hypothetical protein
MAYTTNIKETIQKEELLLRCCYQCSQKFDEVNWKNNNWELEFRTNHKPAWKTFFENDDRGWIGWEIQLRHANCIVSSFNKQDNNCSPKKTANDRK